MKVIWPDIMAIVFKRSLLGEKEVLEANQTRIDADRWDPVAYQMGFSKEEIVWKTVEIQVGKTRDLLALERFYSCPNYGAYYLPQIVLRPLDGKMLPKAWIHVHLDGELIMQGPLLDFLPDIEPLELGKAPRWEKVPCVFKAHAVSQDGTCSNMPIGFMITNGAKLTVHLGKVKAEENVSIEVGVVTAYYSTEQSEVTVKLPKAPENR